VLSHYKGVAIVAAAGNDGWSQCFWPAASSWTTSVGALADDWHRRARKRAVRGVGAVLIP
jgi:hypothetical protein